MRPGLRAALAGRRRSARRVDPCAETYGDPEPVFVRVLSRGPRHARGGAGDGRLPRGARRGRPRRGPSSPASTSLPTRTPRRCRSSACCSTRRWARRRVASCREALELRAPPAASCPPQSASRRWRSAATGPCARRAGRLPCAGSSAATCPASWRASTAWRSRASRRSCGSRSRRCATTWRAGSWCWRGGCGCAWSSPAARPRSRDRVPAGGGGRAAVPAGEHAGVPRTPRPAACTPSRSRRSGPGPRGPPVVRAAPRAPGRGGRLPRRAALGRFGPGSLLYFDADALAASTAFTGEVAYELVRSGTAVGR